MVAGCRQQGVIDAVGYRKDAGLLAGQELLDHDLGTGSAEAAIPAQLLLVNAVKIEFVFVYELTAAEREAAVGTINRMLQSGTLINNVALTLPLSDIIAAHEAVEGGKVMGNVVVSL